MSASFYPEAADFAELDLIKKYVAICSCSVFARRSMDAKTKKILLPSSEQEIRRCPEEP